MILAPLTRRSLMAGLAGTVAAPGLLLSSRARAASTSTIIGVIEEDPPFFNPALSSGISSFVAGCPCYSALTRMDLNGAISGDLAERWEISPDGMVYTFHLRPNIVWHDDVPFTSADVKFSFENVNAKLHPYRGAMAAIASFETPDARTLVMRLSHPQSSLIYTIGNFAGAILPKHIWEGKDPAKDAHNKQPIGTGAYKFVEFVPGDHIRYVKNDKYFLPGKPAFDELVFRIIPDAAARMAAFQNGEIDMIYSSALPASEVVRLKTMKDVELRFSKIQSAGYQAYINTRNAPFNDVRVRQALVYAIDRAFIRSNVFPGLADNMIGPLPPSSPLANKALKDYPLDPAKANALLDEAGFKRGADGTRFPLRYLFGSSDLPGGKIGDVMAQNLAAVGIKVVLQPLERGTLMTRAYTNNEFDMVISSFSLGPDPDVGVERFYNSNNISNIQGVNNSAYRNPELDKLFDEQRVQTDFAKRKAIYDRIQEILWTDVPVFPFCGYSLPGAFRSSSVKGVFDLDGSAREDFVMATPA